MQFIIRFSRFVFSIAAFSSIALSSAYAQVSWLKQFDTNGGLLEFRKVTGAIFNTAEDGYRYKTTPYALMAHGYVHASRNFQCLFQLPIAHSSTQPQLSDFDNKTTATLIGNPYFGFEWAGQGQSSGLLQGGIRLPCSRPDSEETYTDDEEYIAAYAGALITIEQYEAFLPRTFTAYLAGGYIGKTPDNNKIGVRWKSVAGVSCINREEYDANWYADINSELWLQSPYVSIGVGGIARGILNRDVDYFWDRFDAQFGATAVGSIGVFRPQASIRVPLNDRLQSAIDITYSVGLGVDFGG